MGDESIEDVQLRERLRLLRHSSLLILFPVLAFLPIYLIAFIPLASSDPLLFALMSLIYALLVAAATGGAIFFRVLRNRLMAGEGDVIQWPRRKRGPILDWSRPQEAVTAIFGHARAIAPSTIILHNMQALRGGDTADVPAVHSVHSQILKETGRTSSRDGVVVMATASDVSTLDPAMFRDTRFSKGVVLGSGEAGEREAYIAGQLKGMPVDPSVRTTHLASITEGWDEEWIEQLVRSAASRAMRRAMRTRRPTRITMEDFDEARAELGPPPPRAQTSRNPVEAVDNQVKAVQAALRRGGIWIGATTVTSGVAAVHDLLPGGPRASERGGVLVCGIGGQTGANTVIGAAESRGIPAIRIDCRRLAARLTSRSRDSR